MHPPLVTATMSFKIRQRTAYGPCGAVSGWCIQLGKLINGGHNSHSEGFPPVSVILWPWPLQGTRARWLCGCIGYDTNMVGWQEWLQCSGDDVDHLLLTPFPEVIANVTAVPNSFGRKLLKNVQVIKKFSKFSRTSTETAVLYMHARTYSNGFSHAWKH
jgi:hypothetical protein